MTSHVPPYNKVEVVSLGLSPEMIAAIDRAAAFNGVTRPVFLRRIICEAVGLTDNVRANRKLRG